MSLLTRARAITQELGMKTLAGLIGQRITRVSDKIRPPSALSKREIEVLRLVAQGKTNQEIAYELFISEYTVGNHVSSILAKTKTTNRTEAALFCLRNQLIEISHSP
jgi:NarL family two-component system response regulator LiaR